MTKKIVQNELNVRGKEFKCWQCDEVFDKAVYWFDSLYAANYKERIINIFCTEGCGAGVVFLGGVGFALAGVSSTLPFGCS